MDDRAGPPAQPPTEAVPSHPPTMPAKTVQPPKPTDVDPRGPASRANPTIIAPQPPGREASRPTVPPANRPATPYRPEPPTGLAPGAAVAGGAAAGAASEVLRYGPGVPPSQAGVSAEQVWRTGQMPDPPRRPIRGVRRLAGTAVTVILLIAAAILLFLRFHHASFQVAGATITQAVPNGCTVNVTGQISTNGAAGTISYQWVYTPQHGTPQPLSQSVVSGQHAVFVTVSIQGQGHGSATEKVTLQVLGPNQESASRVITISC
ncbi:MAG TPA: hypothetical protein VME19_04085 [Streptosporangiaceae bacterium]|nr:hypothetical protein [Streptosporangiaceae bacterium]